MSDNLELVNVDRNNELVINNLLKCNSFLEKYNLYLTKEDVKIILSNRNEILKSNGRIEFGKPIVEELIKEFCDSLYLSNDNFVQTISELLDIFYYYKNETKGLVTDDELIKFMKKYFDGDAYGDLEILRDIYMEKMRKNVLFKKSMECGFNE